MINKLPVLDPSGVLDSTVGNTPPAFVLSQNLGMRSPSGPRGLGKGPWTNGPNDSLVLAQGRAC